MLSCLLLRCVQDVRGAPKEDESQQSINHIRHQPAVWFHRWPGRPQLFGVSLTRGEKEGACLLKLTHDLHLWCQTVKCLKDSKCHWEPKSWRQLCLCPQVSRRHTDVPAVQQGLDQREDLRAAAPPGSAVVKVKPLIGSRGGGLSRFLISNVCSNCFTLFKVCFKTFISCHVGEGCVLYVNVWLLIIKFFFHSKFVCSASFPPNMCLLSRVVSLYNGISQEILIFKKTYQICHKYIFWLK